MELERPYTVLKVYVSLDPIPGVFHTSESAREVVEALLQRSIPHYDPRVAVSRSDLLPDSV